MDGLLDFFEGVMRDGEVLPATNGLGAAPSQPTVAAEVYCTVLLGLLPYFCTLLRLLLLRLVAHFLVLCRYTFGIV